MPLQENRADASDTEQRKAHYGDGKQPWDTIKERGWAPAFAAANVVKYLRRSKDQEHSLESARWYYARLREMAATKDPTANIVIADLLGELTAEEHAKLAVPGN